MYTYYQLHAGHEDPGAPPAAALARLAENNN